MSYVDKQAYFLNFPIRVLTKIFYLLECDCVELCIEIYELIYLIFSLSQIFV